jgi:hypothetical protein
VVEHLPSKQEALNSTPHPLPVLQKKEKEKKKKEGRNTFKKK